VDSDCPDMAPSQSTAVAQAYRPQPKSGDICLYLPPCQPLEPMLQSLQ